MFDTLPIPSDYVPAGMLTSDRWKALLDQNRPGRSPAGAPIYVAQGTDDPIVRPAVTADFVAGLCRDGAAVQYETLSGVGHMKAGARQRLERDPVDAEPVRRLPRSRHLPAALGDSASRPVQAWASETRASRRAWVRHPG